MAGPASSPSRYAPVAVLAVTLLVFAAVVAYVSLWLRAGLRQQVLGREAEALTEVASLQLANEAEALRALGVEDVPGQLLNAVLKTSKLRGVFAVRVFDAEQHFSGALPLPWSELPPPAEDWKQLADGKPIVRLHSRETPAEVIGLAPAAQSTATPEPLLETWLPLRRADAGPLAGVAQMWIRGDAVAREFAALDRRVLTQAVFAWIAGAVIISALLSWAFRRLAQANRQLTARTEDLLRANRELTLAAKTSALGAVTAHLMHELKNPVAGLEQFVASQSELSGRNDNGGELMAASELTRRLRTMINDVVSVLRDEQTGTEFELTAVEIAEIAMAKVGPVAKARGVGVESSITETAALPARRANLAGLVLQNLMQNAVEASPAGTQVSLAASADEKALRFTVTDQGKGLPASVRERLFQPCTSTKRGGSGLGIALSQQLARQAGGYIELLRSDGNGTCFQLVLTSEE